MSFPTSEGGFKKVDTEFFVLIRSIIKRSRMRRYGQIFQFKQRSTNNREPQIVLLLALKSFCLNSIF